MKFILKKCFFLLVIWSPNCFSDYVDPIYPETIHHEQFLLSYPHSGAHLLLAITQKLTKKTLRHIDMPWLETTSLVNPLSLERDFSKKSLYFTKNAELLTEIDSESNKMILLLRNYKECIPRWRFCNEVDLLESAKSCMGGFTSYLDNILCYHNWSNPKTKLLIYYEDLVKKPRKVIYKLLNFLNESSEQLDVFMSDYPEFEEHLRRNFNTLAPYNEKFSSKKDLFFHSRKFSKETCKEIDGLLKDHYPTLWDTYLKKYETK